MRTRFVVLIGVLCGAMTASAFAGAVRPGFLMHTLPPNDDDHTGLVSMGFSVDFYGLAFSQLHVNNNGNITFDAPLALYTPFDLTSTSRQIIAPFFADVDTRAAGSPVTYGAGSVDGRMAFGANWVDVDCFLSDGTHTVRNSFQVVLIERLDTGAGNFDIELNYDQIQWEAGQASGGSANCQGGFAARAGFSNGTGEPGTFYELPGSGVAGAFLDDGSPDTSLIHNSLNSDVLGRYVFEARDGTIIVCQADSDGDGVCDGDDNCPLTANLDQADGDGDGLGDACDDCRYDADNDRDGDGVCGDIDLCADTVVPEETVPSLSLGVNHWALIDGDDVFDTAPPPDRSPDQPTFTLDDTGGCSCEQILAAQGLGQGHGTFGCSIGVMQEWTRGMSTTTLRSPARTSRSGLATAAARSSAWIAPPGAAAYQTAGCSVGPWDDGPAELLALLGLILCRRRARGSS